MLIKLIPKVKSAKLLAHAKLWTPTVGMPQWDLECSNIHRVIAYCWVVNSHFIIDCHSKDNGIPLRISKIASQCPKRLPSIKFTGQS